MLGEKKWVMGLFFCCVVLDVVFFDYFWCLVLCECEVGCLGCVG